MRRISRRPRQTVLIFPERRYAQPGSMTCDLRARAVTVRVVRVRAISLKRRQAALVDSHEVVIAMDQGRFGWKPEEI
jgi:hypothetical protein